MAEPEGQSDGTVAASAIPSLDRVLRSAPFAPLLAIHGHTHVAQQARAHLAQLRARARDGRLLAQALEPAQLGRAVAQALQAAARPALRPVFNLTGTVLHTNLGRAPLPEVAVQAVADVMRSPANLEFDLDTGARGERDARVAGLVCALTGAEAALVVNNNAAAVLLMLNTLAKERATLVSRGELVEIGGSFRIPDIMAGAGTRLHEVGTTNRTHARDYARAIGPDTALLMKVHCSNYAIQGFVHSVDVAALAALAQAHQLPLAVDLGSGTLLPLSRWGLPDEPTVAQVLAQGADLVSFSGDKLLGGPQAGIVAGRADLIAALQRNPLKRALRAGKLTLAALEAVLRLYAEPEHLAQRLTSLRWLTRPQADIQAQAQRILPALRATLKGRAHIAAVAMASQIGSGALPVSVLPSFGVRLHVPGAGGAALLRLQAALRALPRPVLGRVAEDALWLDLRCLEPEDETGFIHQWATLDP